jgi:hypothetical protein
LVNLQDFDHTIASFGSGVNGQFCTTPVKRDPTHKRRTIRIESFFHPVKKSIIMTENHDEGRFKTSDNGNTDRVYDPVHLPCLP